MDHIPEPLETWLRELLDQKIDYEHKIAAKHFEMLEKNLFQRFDMLERDYARFKAGTESEFLAIRQVHTVRFATWIAVAGLLVVVIVILISLLKP